MVVPAVVQKPLPSMLTVAPESFAKDAMIAWFRGEFTAANAIIDELCSHLRQLEGSGEYESVFAAIHRRRVNWIPILHMQKFYNIADVTKELQKVAATKKGDSEKVEEVTSDGSTTALNEKDENVKNLEKSLESDENGGDKVVNEDLGGNATSEREITDTGSQEMQPSQEHIIRCSSKEDCEARRAQIKTNKSFVAKEPVKGHMVNVAKGLKLYENIFTDVELSKLHDFVNELRVAGQNGELSGDTFILFNQQTKGNKRELIQFGVPIFERIKEDTTDETQQSYIEPIPSLLQGVIEHLIHWHLIPEHKKPTSCIINFFDEEEYSHPFLKPPHLEQSLSTLLLSESKMAFGRALASDSEGNYRGSLMLSLKEGSLLVMSGNSSDTARHAMCSSENKRVSITFFKVRNETERNNHLSSINTPPTNGMTLWQPSVASPFTNMISRWGPLVMLAPVRPLAVSPRAVQRDGTGVFLPGTGSDRPRKPAKQLPPRAQRRRFVALPSPRKAEISSESGSISS